MAFLAGGAVAVVAVALVVFLVLSSSRDKGGSSSNAQPPASSSSAPATPSTTPSSSAPPVKSSGNVEWGPAGTLAVNFYKDAGSPTAWAMLTPSAQAAFGDQAAFASYWDQNKPTSYRGANVYKHQNNPDGSADVQITLTMQGGSSMQKVVQVIAGPDGTLMINSDPRIGSGTPAQ